MTCQHRHIRTWVFEDTGEPTGLWSCEDCGLKFEPIQPAREPVIDKAAAVHIATALGWEPKRKWVGLTHTEAADCWNTSATKTWNNIEAKLKEKNA